MTKLTAPQPLPRTTMRSLPVCFGASGRSSWCPLACCLSCKSTPVQASHPLVARHVALHTLDTTISSCLMHSPSYAARCARTGLPLPHLWLRSRRSLRSQDSNTSHRRCSGSLSLPPACCDGQRPCGGHRAVHCLPHRCRLHTPGTGMRSRVVVAGDSAVRLMAKRLFCTPPDCYLTRRGWT